MQNLHEDMKSSRRRSCIEKSSQSQFGSSVLVLRNTWRPADEEEIVVRDTGPEQELSMLPAGGPTVWGSADVDKVAESGRLRLTRSKLLAKRPHSGGHWPETRNWTTSRKTSGRPREDLLPLAPRHKLHFGEIPKKFRQNLNNKLATITQNSGKNSEQFGEISKTSV